MPWPWKMLKDRSAAENAVQHVFVKLWIGRQEMTVMLSLRNYLYTMTRNYILNYLRSRNTELVHSYRLAQLIPEASDPLDAQIEREDLLQMLDTVIAGLPTQKRQVMYLRKAGYSNPEIAEMLNLSVNTVRSHYQEGVKLRRAVSAISSCLSSSCKLYFYETDLSEELLHKTLENRATAAEACFGRRVARHRFGPGMGQSLHRPRLRPAGVLRRL